MKQGGESENLKLLLVMGKSKSWEGALFFRAHIKFGLKTLNDGISLKKWAVSLGLGSAGWSSKDDNTLPSPNALAILNIRYIRLFGKLPLVCIKVCLSSGLSTVSQVVRGSSASGRSKQTRWFHSHLLSPQYPGHHHHHHHLHHHHQNPHLIMVTCYHTHSNNSLIIVILNLSYFL